MQELMTTANLVDYETLEARGSIAAMLARSELEAAMHAHESVGLWFELGRGEEEETRRLTLELTSADVEGILQSSLDEELIVTLDADAVADLLADPDVEAHGIRGALAIAVATAAVAAPAGLAATPQATSPAATSQVSSQISSQVSTQVSSLAAEAQVAGLVAETQVAPQVNRAAALAQVRAQMAKAQVKKGLVLKAAGVTLLRGGLAQ